MYSNGQTTLAHRGGRRAIQALVESAVRLGQIVHPYPAILYSGVEEMGLMPRINQRLKIAHIETIGQLIQMTDREMLDITGLGRNCLNEIKESLAEMGLSLGMTIGDGGELIAPPE